MQVGKFFFLIVPLRLRQQRKQEKLDWAVELELELVGVWFYILVMNEPK